MQETGQVAPDDQGPPDWPMEAAQSSSVHIRWRSTRGWFLPLSLSLVFHAMLLGTFWMISPLDATMEIRAGSFTVDTVMRDSSTEISIVVLDHGPTGKQSPIALVAEPFSSPAKVVARSGPPAVQSGTSQAAVAAKPTSRAGLAGNDKPMIGGGTTRGGQGSISSGTTSFFAIATEARAVVYVIDRSGSMELNGSLEAAKRELRASLERLQADALFQVIAYSSSAGPLRIEGQCGLVRATPENKRLALAQVDVLYGEGNTNHAEALRVALSLYPEAIYLLTDGGDIRPEQIRRITQQNHGRSTIHAVELLSGLPGPRERPLEALAHANHGLYRALSLGQPNEVR